MGLPIERETISWKISVISKSLCQKICQKVTTLTAKVLMNASVNG